MVKGKLPPKSGSSLEAVEPHPRKGTIKFKVFFISYLINRRNNDLNNKDLSLLSSSKSERPLPTMPNLCLVICSMSIL